MKLEIERFGAGHMSLIEPGDSFVEDPGGFWGPEKTVPEVGTAKIQANFEWVGVDDRPIIDVVKNRIVSVEEFTTSEDLYELVVCLDEKGNSDGLRLKAVMSDGNAYESKFDVSWYDEGEEEPYKGIFLDWKNVGGQEVTLAVPADPVFLSKIGFSFSRTV